MQFLPTEKKVRVLKELLYLTYRTWWLQCVPMGGQGSQFLDACGHKIGTPTQYPGLCRVGCGTPRGTQSTAQTNDIPFDRWNSTQWEGYQKLTYC